MNFLNALLNLLPSYIRNIQLGFFGIGQKLSIYHGSRKGLAQDVQPLLRRARSNRIGLGYLILRIKSLPQGQSTFILDDLIKQR